MLENVTDSQGAERSDILLFETPWIRIKQTKHDFHFTERKGRDSIALFLLRREVSASNEPQVLIRWQRSVYGENRDENYPAPITGSIDKSISLLQHVVEEGYEEAGYRLKPDEITFLTKAACSTQSNEICYLYACDVTDNVPAEKRERISWEPLPFLQTCTYAVCQLGYFLIREILAQPKQ